MSGINFLIVIGVLLISLCYHLFWYLIEPHIESLCEIEAKPLIYGEEQCENIFKHNIYVTENALVTIFVALLSPKIIIRGRLDGKPVYLKKLAKENEMKLVEKQFKSAFKNFKLDKKLIPFVVENMNDFSLNPHLENNVEVHKIQLCPESTEINKLLEHLPNFTSFDIYQYINVWTSLHVNPEPILLQVLHEPVWPVPKYYGSCGRLAVVEDCGKTVTDHYDSPWDVRANISGQILEAAFKFTLGHPNLAFYITDSSPDNIAVSDDGIVKFIDLEHVIVVVKHPQYSEPGWYINHTSEYTECTNCYSFNPKNICSHWISDHNIFTVCREILYNTSLLLRGGLLYGKPTWDISSNILQNLLQECVNPTNGASRFQIGAKIMELLKNS
uniref:Protein-kinase domain of fam69 n=1 Tax=Panstrongylus lignarius TaxID=156445 RepID=A0A224XRF3_9HEMI